MSDLAEFLLARIAEDEDVLTRSEPFPHYSHGYDDVGTYSGTCPTCRQMIWGSHQRALAECQAKRRIVEAEAGRWQTRDDAPIAEMRTDSWANRVTVHFDTGGEETMTSAQFRDRYEEPFLSDTLRLLALPYADHPDYREEWRP